MKQKVKTTLAAWIKKIDVEPKKNFLVYETEKPKIKREMVSDIARNFGISGSITSNEGVHIIVQKREVTALCRDTGAFWYGNFAKLHSPDYSPELPSEDKATKIAEEYLKKNNWLPEGAKLDGLQRNNFERLEGEKRRKRGKQPNNITVNYRFSLNNIDTYGPGAKIKVFIGHKGEVIGLFSAVPALHKYAEFAPLSRKDMEEILKEKLGISLDKTNVIDVKFAYHTVSSVVNCRFIQPVYVFTLAAPVKSKREKRTKMVEFVTHPIPATTFAPVVMIEAGPSPVQCKQGDFLTLSCKVKGGAQPYKYNWESNIDGHIGDESTLETKDLSISHRNGRVTSHTIKVTVTDERGMQDSHYVLVTVIPKERTKIQKRSELETDPDDPYVGVEWCNIYHGTPGLADISGTDSSAQGFNNHIKSLPNYSSRFDWGNDNAWEQDFKFATAPGGGADSYWSDNVHFAYFAGHGSPGSFYFGSTVDDHEMRAQDARWGDGILNWIVLHACQTMRANFGWTVWCDAFQGLHQMFGFHTNTEGSTPPLGSRFALWMTFRIFPWMDAFDMQTAWKIACTECFDSSMEYAVIYAGQTGTDTYNDHLPGYGHVSSDPTSPSYWAYYKGSC